MSGTITMLFTDVEASTLLLQRLGEHWAEALTAQRRAMRRAVEQFSGREMGTEGDSFFVVFDRAEDGVGAAISAQRSLAAVRWPAGERLRVRMGLHTGEPTPHEDGYIGLDVHRAARVAAAAHGGQILITAATAALIADRLPSGCSLHDLGAHRLKDLPSPERLWQLEPDDLVERFAPPRSLGARSALPRPASATVGRTEQIADLVELLGSATVRLVTVTGPGGVGKTRVSLAAARALADDGAIDTYFATLAAVSRDEEIWPAVAEVLGIGEGAEALGIGEGAEALGAAARILAGRRALLVLDNLEHLPAAAGVVESLIDTAPELTVLATSRSPLRILGEREYALGPMATAAPDRAGRRALDSVALFTQRARAARADFRLTDDVVDDVAAICAQVDGMPLAIELAAARITLLSPAALRRRLDSTLDVLGADRAREDRHRTLDATISWSYELLPPHAQIVFRRCGVFAGGFDLSALAAVALVDSTEDPLDALNDLVESSLCRVLDTPAGEPRALMLRAVREFALARLRQEGEWDAVAADHARTFAEAAEAADAHIHGARQQLAVDWFRAERDNLSAALTWCLDGPPTDEQQLLIALRIVRAASFFWFSRTPGSQARTWLAEVVSRLDAVDAAGIGITAGPQFADAVHGLALQVGQQGNYVTAEQLLQRALSIRESLGDAAGVSMELNSLGVFARATGDIERGAALLDRSVAAARDSGDARRLVNALSNQAVIAVDRNEFDRALPLLEEIVVMDRQAGDRWAIAADEVNISVALLHLHRDGEARARLLAAIPLVQDVGDVELDVNLVEVMALLLTRVAADAQAARLSGSAARFREQADLPMPEPDAVRVEAFHRAGRERVGVARWDTAMQEGRELSLAQAVEIGRRALRA